jgi:hypothetical protein
MEPTTDTKMVILATYAKEINTAKSTLDLFGELAGVTVEERLKSLKHAYNPLVKKVFPDAYVGMPKAFAMAEIAFSRLAAFRSTAEAEIRRGDYGKPVELIHITALGKTYVLGEAFAAGDMSDLYVSGRDLLKIVRSAEDNDLMVVEQTNLEKLRKYITGRNADVWLQTIPEVKLSFRLPDTKRVNVLDYHAGFISGEEVVTRIEKVDARTIAWMFKRILALLEWVGHAGLVHGAILPSHLLFFPDNANVRTRDDRKHSVHLVDWCYSVPADCKLKAFVANDIAFYPNEILHKQPVTFQTDLFMAVKCMIFLSGGDPARNQFPADFPARLADHMLICLHPDPMHRVKSRRSFYNEFVRLLKDEFGTPKWHDFIVPGIPTIN